MLRELTIDIVVHTMKKLSALLIIGIFISSIYSVWDSFQKPVSAEVQVLGNYIQQSIVSKDGLQTWYRTCPINLDNSESVTDWENCTPFQGPDTVNNFSLPGYVHNSGIRDISAFVYKLNNQPYVRQSLVSADGKTIWSRSCPVRDTIEWNNCLPSGGGGIWTVQKIADFKLPKGNDATIVNLSEFSVNVTPIDLDVDLGIDIEPIGLLIQFLVGDDGNMWMRFCTTNPTAGIDTCQSWMRENIAEMTTGAPIVSAGDIEDFSMYAIQKLNTEIELSISLLHADGDHVYTQTCNVDPSEALSADLTAETSDMESVFGCDGAWIETQLSTFFVPPTGFGTAFTSFNTYSYQTLHPIQLCELREDGDISCDGKKNNEDHQLWWTEHIGASSSKFADLDDNNTVTGSDFEILRQKHFDPPEGGQN